MLDEAFDRVYTKFKLHFYRSVFSRFQQREASLTTVETFCMEIINALGRPTINEFSSFVNISPPNAAYKINNLIQKGYVVKEQSPDDKREYHLAVTQKYVDYYNISYRYLSTVMDRIKERFSAEDVEKLEEMGLNAHVSVGGSDSITLLLFLRKIWLDLPAISVSVLEDKSIQKVHSELGIIKIRPDKNKVQVLNEVGFPVISKKIAGR